MSADCNIKICRSELVKMGGAGVGVKPFWVPYEKTFSPK